MSPVHTLDSFLDYGQKLKDLGADSICIKDMAGMLTPYRTERMVKAFNAEIGLPLHIHCHYVGGMRPPTSSKPPKPEPPSPTRLMRRWRSATRIRPSR